MAFIKTGDVKILDIKESDKLSEEQKKKAEELAKKVAEEKNQTNSN